MDRPFPLVTVGGLLRDEAGHALLVRTRKWSDKWGIPGGKVELGESLEAAFSREILEETGLAARAPRLVMIQEAIDHPEFHRPAHFVLINYVADVTGIRPVVALNDEAQAYKWATLAEAEALDLNGPTRKLLDLIQDENAAGARQGETAWAL
jgi:ADP-ribose pyrophosphatase YjhB (NUDIX family)